MAEGKQRLLLDDRKELLISGVRNVDSFDEQRIELDSSLGGIGIDGEGLKIGALNLEEGKVTISGQINGIIYMKSREERSMRQKRHNLLARLMK